MDSLQKTYGRDGFYPIFFIMYVKDKKIYIYISFKGKWKGEYSGGGPYAAV